jgi:ketosteroid isomerase-like protein
VAVAVANLELVRDIYSGWSRGEFDRIDWADPAIEFAYTGGPEPGRWSGLAGMSAGWREWLRDWVDFRAAPVAYVVIDRERILVLVHNTGRGRTSGLELEQRSAGNLFEIHAGRVRRLVVYLDIERAYSDLGIEPQPGAADPWESVEIVRRAMAAFNAGDLDTALAELDPEAELDWSRSAGVEAGVYRGHDQIRDFWNTFLETFERTEVTPDEFIEYREHVLAPNLARMSGRDGIQVQAHSVAFVTLRGRRIFRWRLLRDLPAALEAVGLADAQPSSGAGPKRA